MAISRIALIFTITLISAITRAGDCFDIYDPHSKLDAALQKAARDPQFNLKASAASLLLEVTVRPPLDVKSLKLQLAAVKSTSLRVFHLTNTEIGILAVNGEADQLLTSLQSTEGVQKIKLVNAQSESEIRSFTYLDQPASYPGRIIKNFTISEQGKGAAIDVVVWTAQKQLLGGTELTKQDATVSEAARLVAGQVLEAATRENRKVVKIQIEVREVYNAIVGNKIVQAENAGGQFNSLFWTDTGAVRSGGLFHMSKNILTGEISVRERNFPR